MTGGGSGFPVKLVMTGEGRNEKKCGNNRNIKE